MYFFLYINSFYSVWWRRHPDKWSDFYFVLLFCLSDSRCVDGWY